MPLYIGSSLSLSLSLSLTHTHPEHAFARASTHACVHDAHACVHARGACWHAGCVSSVGLMTSLV